MCDITNNGKAGFNSYKAKGEDDPENLWFYMGIGSGFIVGFWDVCGSLAIKKSWRHAYFKFLYGVEDKLFMFITRSSLAIKMKMARNKEAKVDNK